MNTDRINLFMAKNARMLPAEMLQTIASQLLMVPDDCFGRLMEINFRNPTIALVFSLTFGYLGLDRFYIGDTFAGLLKLVTGGACGIWTVVDWFLIMGTTRRKNMEKLMKTLSYYA